MGGNLEPASHEDGDNAYDCAWTQSSQDANSGPNPPCYHCHFKSCNEDAQCQAAGEPNCQGAIDMYFAEGPGGDHYEIIMGDYCYFAWGECEGCSSKFGNFITNN